MKVSDLIPLTHKPAEPSGRYIYTKQMHLIGIVTEPSVPGPSANDIAEFICRACNTHEALASACKNAAFSSAPDPSQRASMPYSIWQQVCAANRLAEGKQ